MKIRIKRENCDRLSAALKEVNCRASRHVFTHWVDLESVIDKAESLLTQLGIPKSHWVGTWFNATSGNDMPTAYKYNDVVRTKITIERCATGWFMTRVDRGVSNMRLTEWQRFTMSVPQESLRIGQSKLNVIPRPKA